MIGSIRGVLPAFAFGLFAACATTKPQLEPEYQIGVTGSRLTRAEAERAHAGGSPQTAVAADLESAPRLLSSPFPDYPRTLQDRGIEGRVLVAFVVEPDGSVSDAAVQGSPPPQLAALSLDAIRRWKFAPAMKNGLPVRARLQQPFLFRIE